MRTSTVRPPRSTKELCETFLSYLLGGKFSMTVRILRLSMLLEGILFATRSTTFTPSSSRGPPPSVTKSSYLFGLRLRLMREIAASMRESVPARVLAASSSSCASVRSA